MTPLLPFFLLRLAFRFIGLVAGQEISPLLISSLDRVRFHRDAKGVA